MFDIIESERIGKYTIELTYERIEGQCYIFLNGQIKSVQSDAKMAASLFWEYVHLLEKMRDFEIIQ